MSAALQAEPRHAAVIPLTTLNPTPGDLRYRAHYWRQHVMRDPHAFTADDYCAVLDSCDAMLALASRMENPAPVARIVPARAPRVAKAKAIGAAEFWTLHGHAVRAMIAAHGLRWYLTAPEETGEITLPARLCSYVGPLGGRIRWRRDHRMPAAKYWPGGALPDGVAFNPIAPRYDGPMGDDHPSLVMIREAVAEQIMRDRIMRGRAAIVAHWQAQHRMVLLALARTDRRGTHHLTRRERFANLATAGNCRRAMAAELGQIAA